MKNAAKSRYKDKFQEFVSDERRRRLYERESLAFDATELICRLMEEKKITKAELARRIGKTRGYITQLLSGSRNMTVYTLADLALALDSRIELKSRPCSINADCSDNQSDAKTPLHVSVFQAGRRPVYASDDEDDLRNRGKRSPSHRLGA